MTVTVVPDGETTIPPGYTEEDVALCKALTSQFVSSLEGVTGHVAMSAVLTTLNSMVDTFDAEARFRSGQHLITVGAGIANAAIDALCVTPETVKTPTAIAQQISNLIATERHGQALDALLMVFKVLAQKFPCCTKVAADMAARVSQELSTAGALTRMSGSEHLH